MDRLGTKQIGPWWCRLTWTKAGAYSFYFRKKRLLFKPIDYGSVAQ